MSVQSALADLSEVQDQLGLRLAQAVGVVPRLASGLISQKMPVGHSLRLVHCSCSVARGTPCGHGVSEGGEESETEGTF